MAEKNYTYDPVNIGERGKDRMRFELGDTMVEGGAETSALADEEIDAVLSAYPDKWKKAKLVLAESVCRRFAFEVDTGVGPLSLGLRDRADAWRAIYEELKASVGNCAAPTCSTAATKDGPYFYAGMMENRS